MEQPNVNKYLRQVVEDISSVDMVRIITQMNTDWNTYMEEASEMAYFAGINEGKQYIIEELW